MNSRAALLAFGLAACVQQPPRPADFNFADGGLLSTAATIPRAAMTSIEGVYAITSNDARFGPRMSLRVSAQGVTFMGDQDGAAYVISRYGCVTGSGALLEGSWRDIQTRPQGVMRLTVMPAEASEALCQGAAIPADVLARVTLQGSFTVGRGGGPMNDGTPVTFTREGAPRDTGGRFLVAAHHGACQTSDECGVSENTLQSVRRVEILGANAIELDVQLTADGVPILFHDETFTPRLTRGVYCHGRVADFTLAHVQSLCRSLYDEQIPTLAEALTVVLNETELRAVWLDMKTPAAMNQTLEIVAQAGMRARMNHRSITMFVGLPDDDTIAAYTAARTGRGDPPRRMHGGDCLIELDPDDVRSAECSLWGPRWTRGPLVDDVLRAQMQGIRVAFWTVDDPQFIDTFLVMSAPNMLVTDRPGFVQHHFNLVGRMPPGGEWPR